MRVRPFGSDRFLVDIAEGDIFAESGDVLVVGRPKGLRSSSHHLGDPALWQESDLITLPWRQPLRYSRTDLPWRDAYAFPYKPKDREHLPNGACDVTAIRYSMVRNELEAFLFSLGIRYRSRGELKVGLVPLSWRKPEVVAHIMVEALSGLFYCVRDTPGLKSLTVLIRSLDEPQELAQVFDRGYFKAWRKRMGWPASLQDVWTPA